MSELILTIITVAMLVILSFSNSIEIRRLERSRIHDVLEKISKLVGAVSCLLYIRFYEASSAPTIIYLQVALLGYFVVINRVAVYIICNRLSKVARSENT